MQNYNKSPPKCWKLKKSFMNDEKQKKRIKNISKCKIRNK